MISIERMYKYMELLETKRHVTALEFQEVMEISCATFKRDLAALRDRFDVPIVYDRDIGAYKLDRTCDRKRLPGIWFNSREIQIIKLIEEQIIKFESHQFSNEVESLRVKLERACHPAIK
jgi:predicted DNA-binding transcriptional regulator YafY